ncbi:MAG TPA: SDR family NAD(P)-dependent oxidoreductase [Streptosporangiaceae bacterium]|nr:SDR family NAD(P)-dependent oxidoreductase [Streptosporangiaceae bacterium]
MWLAGAVALITGASSGIGTATALALSAAGARLVLSGRDPDRLAAVAAQTGGLAIPCDLTEPDGPDKLAAAALRDAGRIDVLVSNAGIGWAGPIGNLTAAKAAELVALNLVAPAQLARLVAPGMAERQHGRLVFVSSIAGAIGVRNEAVYAAAKAGLNCLAESLSYELAGQGVGVSLILPGVVDTPFFRRQGRRYARSWPIPIPAERVASAITDAVTHDREVVYVPGWMRLPAWLHGVAPVTFRRLATRFS